jgi:hypothetical protein
MTTYTPNYNLDKYEGTDKPNLRDQYNSAMDKIDTELKDLADTDVQTSTNVLNLQNRMNTAESNITNLQEIAASHTQQIANNKTTADHALSLAQTNESDIASNTTMLSTHAESLATLESQMASTIRDLSELGTNVESVNVPIVSTVQNCDVAGSIVIRKNPKLHIANFGGLLSLTNNTGSQVIINALTLSTEVPANFRPATDRTIMGLLMGFRSVTISGVLASRFAMWDPKLTTDGRIVAFENDPQTMENGENFFFVFNQYLLFTNDWGTNY